MITLNSTESTFSEAGDNPLSGLVYFAPVASYPARHGGAIRSLRLFEEIARQTGARATMVGANFSLYIEGPTRIFQDRFPRQRSRIEGAIRSFIFRDHYLRAKQMNQFIVREFLREVARIQPEIVLMSYLYSSTLLPHLRDQQVFIDTHNNDWEWFENLREATANPFKRAVCNNSLRHTDKFLKKLNTKVSLVHVSNRDQTAYAERRPDLMHFVVPNGCDVKPRQSRPNYEERPLRLLFVGSLASRMNIDALGHFSSRFWPHVKGFCQLTVAGSTPPGQVVSLCRRERWNLEADVSDARLEELYTESHYAILPFPYGCGSKLKLVEACGRGLPVLSTGPGSTGIESPLPACVMVSDRPDEWAVRLRDQGVTRAMESEARQFANLHSWEISASTLINAISSILEKDKSS